MRLSLIVAAALFMAPAAALALDPSWTGTWHGVLQNLPGRAGAERIDVTFEAGKLPEREGECATWRTRYLHGAELRHLKDYRLCRLAGEGEYTVDEGDGIKLPTRLLGDTLYSIFKFDTHLLTVITRKRGDMLEQEIISATDQPAGKGVVTLHPSSVQRTTLSRAKP
ncbi:hypothetical protein [Sphingomonas colocasiae]|uniref:Lipocalin-like domain-containing protein n=1 Tax=Sphingomonas colocasiae TaxID=1848973 RepID=A0ABS7PRM4_9SPHN|nr:hypothetical protein [Sphingomonas colocasiae]MBY8823985.1 hypothetical protein [Sphingomonas colocasiae]